MKNILNVFANQKGISWNKVFPIFILGLLSILPSTIWVDSVFPVNQTVGVIIDFQSSDLIKNASNRQIDIVVGQSRDEQQIRADLGRKALELAKNTQNREVYSRESTIRISGPSNDEKRSIVKDIASRNSIDWKVLEAVWEVESGKSWDRSVVSSAGAQGPMQFLPSTFRHYAVSGASITSARDSLEAGAKLLASAGAASGNVDQALFSYNHSSAYVSKV